MRKLFSILLLTLAAAPAFSSPTAPGTQPLPEPEVLSLMAIGFLSLAGMRYLKGKK